jgi:putative copper export protein
MVITQRFGKLSGFALGILLVTGLYQFYGVVPTAVSDDMMSYRFGMLFMSKMLLFTIVVALVALHVIVGKRVGKLTEAVIAGEGEEFELDNARRRSFLLSALLMFVSFAVLAFGVMLGRGEFSYVLG